MRQTRPSLPTSGRRHALLLRAITANLSFPPLLAGELIRDAIASFRRQMRAAIITGDAAPTSLRTLKPKFSLDLRIANSDLSNVTGEPRRQLARSPAQQES